MQTFRLDSEKLAEIAPRFGREILASEKRPLCIAVCDDAGKQLFFLRMNGAAARGIAIAIQKAYTAAIMECSTARLGQRLAEERLTLADFCDPAFTSMPGGEPVQINGKTIGGVGLSGLKPVRDGEMAQTLVRQLLTHAVSAVQI